MDKIDAFKNNIEVEKVCRVCMKTSSNMCNIFENKHVNSQTISEIITYCTGLEMEKHDQLPRHICEDCNQNLETAYTFKSICLKTDERLRQSIEIKIEDDPPDYDNLFDDLDVTIYGVKESNRMERKAVRRKGIKKKAPKIMRPKEEDNKKIDESLHCDVCDLSFETKQQRNRHRMKHDTRDWICEICGLVFQHRSSHYTHVKSHLPPKFACDNCDYQTVYKHDLVKHIRIHSGLKQFQCEYCTTSYYVVSNLKSHIQRCHKKVKRFTCPTCNYKFYDKTKLKLHMDSHNDIKRHHCEYCGSNFSRITYLKNHLYKNHGVEPVKIRPGRPKINTVMEDAKDCTL